MEQTRNPTPDEVREIFNEVYNKFFLKFKESKTDEDFLILHKEALEIDKKFPFKISRVMLKELIDIIDNYSKERGKANA